MCICLGSFWSNYLQSQINCVPSTQKYQLWLHTWVGQHNPCLFTAPTWEWHSVTWHEWNRAGTHYMWEMYSGEQCMFISKVAFFTLNGQVNRHNNRYSLTRSPHTVYGVLCMNVSCSSMVYGVYKHNYNSCIYTKIDSSCFMFSIPTSFFREITEEKCTVTSSATIPQPTTQMSKQLPCGRYSTNTC